MGNTLKGRGQAGECPPHPAPGGAKAGLGGQSSWARPGPPPACSPFWCLPLQDLLHQCRPAPQAPAPAPVSLGVWWEGGREGALLRVPGLCLVSFLLLRPRGGGIVSVCLDLCLQQAASHPKLSVLGPQIPSPSPILHPHPHWPGDQPHSALSSCSSKGQGFSRVGGQNAVPG